MKLNLSIVTEKQRVIQFAAQELKNYLCQINPKLQITITDEPERAENLIRLSVINPKRDFPEPAFDSYEINIQNLSGFITASNPRSVLLGVYKYLTLIGCRFLRPGKDYEKLPHHDNIEAFHASCKCISSLRHRGVCIEGADSKENILDFIDWLPKLGYNSFFIQFQIPYSFMDLWYRHKNNSLLAKEPFDIATATKYSQEIDCEIQKRGLLHHRVGHGWTSEAMGESSLGWASSHRPLNDEAKSMTALINGKRGYFGGIPTNTNLCYSDPRAISRFTNCVVTYAKLHPEVDYLHVWLADEANNHCECEDCKRTSYTDLYLRMLNIIDEKMTAENISTKIVFLLYHELLWPAKTEKLKNKDRFVLMFAPISRTFNRSFKDRRKLNSIPAYQRNHITLPNSLEENLTFLKAWQHEFQGDSFDYDYPLGRAHYGDLGYTSIAKILYQDIHELLALNLNGYLSCQELRCFLPNALPNYVMGLACFNTSLSFEEIENDYFKNAYGTDWKKCKDYLEVLSSYCSCDYFNNIGSRTDPKIAKNMRKAHTHVEKFRPVIQSHLTSGSPLENEFWKHLDYHASYCLLLTTALAELADGRAEEMALAWKQFLQYIQSNELRFQKALDVYRVIEVATNYTGFPKPEND